MLKDLGKDIATAIALAIFVFFVLIMTPGAGP